MRYLSGVSFVKYLVEMRDSRKGKQMAAKLQVEKSICPSCSLGSASPLLEIFRSTIPQYYIMSHLIAITELIRNNKFTIDNVLVRFHSYSRFLQDCFSKPTLLAHSASYYLLAVSLVLRSSPSIPRHSIHRAK